MLPSRHILHINIVSFYASVAGAADPAIRSRPVAVSTAGTGRPVVMDMSAEAMRQGVRRGMPLDAARRQCRDLVVVQPMPRLYDRVCRAVMEEAAKLSPGVEPAGPGHVFIDLTGTERLWGRAVDTGAAIRGRIRERLGLDTAVGVAANKLVSKVATRVIKPSGLCDIMRGCEAEFLGPLPIRMLPGITRAELLKLSQFNVLNISELCLISQRRLAETFGCDAERIHQLAHGIDDSPVLRFLAPLPAESETRILREQTNDEGMVTTALADMVGRLCFRVRKAGLAANRVRLMVTYGDGMQVTVDKPLRHPSNGDMSVFRHVQRFYREACTRRVRLSELFLELADLTAPYGQLDLFENGEKEEQLMQALDAVRGKFGAGSIGGAGAVGDPGLRHAG